MTKKLCSDCYYADYPFNAIECRDCDKITKTNWTPKDLDTAQEAKADAGKIDPTLVPRQIIWDIAEVREYGNKKYGSPDNWKEVEVKRYRAAAFRHMLAYLDDPSGVDEESGIQHYKHLACNLAFICALEGGKV